MLIKEIFISLGQIVDQIAGYLPAKNEKEMQLLEKKVEEIIKISDVILEEWIQFEEIMTIKIGSHFPGLFLDAKIQETIKEQLVHTSSNLLQDMPKQVIKVEGWQDEQFIKAKGYFDLGMYKQSYTILHEIIHQHTDNEMVRLYLAYSAFFSDLREEAITHFQFLRSSCSDTQIRAVCYNAIGIINFDEYKYDYAKNAFTQAVKEDAKLFAAYYNLGMINYTEGNFKEAIKHWEHYLQLTQDDHLEIFVYLSNCYLKLGQYSLAMEIVQRMIPHNHEQVLLQLGRFYEDTNKNDDAIACYESLLKQNPKHTEAMHGLGWNLWLINPHNEQSIPLLKKALSLQKEKENLSIVFSLAWIYFHKDMIMESEKANKWLMDQEESSPLSTALAFLIALHKGDEEHAVQEIASLREQKDIRNRALGDLLFGKLKLQQHLLNEAIEAFKRSTYNNPLLQENYLMQGIAYYLNNDIEKASIVLKKQQFITQYK